MKELSVIDDVGRHLAKKWNADHGYDAKTKCEENPWSLKRIAEIKKEYSSNKEAALKKYPDLFYYMDGLIDTKVSQSVHPAGIVISPITLDDNFGIFDKDGDVCLMLDMENIHDFTGLAKYDFLILKTLQVIRDTCTYIGQSYPMTHEINWSDDAVWDDIVKSPFGIFQMEGNYAFESLKKFKPRNIFEMSIVTACIRPSGASYRDELLARQVHKNPSKLIDDLLKDNLGYLIYQEDTIKFLQEICGLSGSDADTIRRGIARKKKEIVDDAMPRILDGYCKKSSQLREVAEAEAKEFLQVIEDSASYQFGYNHSIAYCLLGYLCAYYRYYHPIEFITSFLNNAANDEDIRSGTEYAKKIGIQITMPKWGASKSEYFYDADKKVIAKGLASVKYMSSGVAEELYKISSSKRHERFVDVLLDLDKDSMINTRQIDVLIKIDFFSEYGNQRDLLYIVDFFYNLFNRGDAKKITKTKIDGTILEPIVAKYATGITKIGGAAKSYTLLDVESILREAEDAVKALHMEDLDDVTKVQNFKDIMGYAGYVSGKEKDRPKLYVLNVYPLVRRKDGKQFGYSVITKSIGSGIESRFTVLNALYNQEPIREGEIILCKGYELNGGSYFRLTSYEHILS